MNGTIQSFIVSGTIMSFECDIDLAAPGADERIDELAGDLRRVIQRMRKRVEGFRLSVVPPEGAQS